jgi:hypothetical protein
MLVDYLIQDNNIITNSTSHTFVELVLAVHQSWSRKPCSRTKLFANIIIDNSTWSFFRPKVPILTTLISDPDEPFQGEKD